MRAKELQAIFLLEVKNIYKCSFMLQKVEYIQSTLKSSRSDTPVSPLPSGTEHLAAFEYLYCQKPFPLHTLLSLFHFIEKLVLFSLTRTKNTESSCP